MKSYSVLISYRPNINSLARKEKVYSIAARSQAGAVFQAAYKLGQSLEPYLSGSEQVTVKLTRSTW